MFLKEEWVSGDAKPPPAGLITAKHGVHLQKKNMGLTNGSGLLTQPFDGVTHTHNQRTAPKRGDDTKHVPPQRHPFCNLKVDLALYNNITPACDSKCVCFQAQQ